MADKYLFRTSVPIVPIAWHDQMYIPGEEFRRWFKTLTGSLNAIDEGAKTFYFYYGKHGEVIEEQLLGPISTHSATLVNITQLKSREDSVLTPEDMIRAGRIVNRIIEGELSSAGEIMDAFVKEFRT